MSNISNKCEESNERFGLNYAKSYKRVCIQTAWAKNQNANAFANVNWETLIFMYRAYSSQPNNITLNTCRFHKVFYILFTSLSSAAVFFYYLCFLFKKIHNNKIALTKNECYTRNRILALNNILMLIRASLTPCEVKCYLLSVSRTQLTLLIRGRYLRTSDIIQKLHD